MSDCSARRGQPPQTRAVGAEVGTLRISRQGSWGHPGFLQTKWQQANPELVVVPALLPAVSHVGVNSHCQYK